MTSTRIRMNRKDCKEPLAPVKKEEKDEVELKEGDEDDHLHQDKDEQEECKKVPAAFKIPLMAAGDFLHYSRSSLS
jgi:hypothetical protein